MSDRVAKHPPTPLVSTSIGEIISGLEPMGDLGQFAIEDLSVEDEDEFFRLLETA